MAPDVGSHVTISPGPGITSATLSVSQDDVDLALSGKAQIWVWGYMEWSEALPGGNLHHIRWCALVNPHKNSNGITFSYVNTRNDCNTRD